MRTPTFTCASCDATVVDGPVFHLGLAFCCAGCAADGPCMCSYDALGTDLAQVRASAIIVDPGATDAPATRATAAVEPPALTATTITLSRVSPPAATRPGRVATKAQPEVAVERRPLAETHA
jgi:hypothetical protein